MHLTAFLTLVEGHLGVQGERILAMERVVCQFCAHVDKERSVLKRYYGKDEVDAAARKKWGSQSDKGYAESTVIHQKTDPKMNE